MAPMRLGFVHDLDETWLRSHAGNPGSGRLRVGAEHSGLRLSELSIRQGTLRVKSGEPGELIVDGRFLYGRGSLCRPGSFCLDKSPPFGESPDLHGITGDRRLEGLE